jgi:putative DNA primase/helicase
MCNWLVDTHGHHMRYVVGLEWLTWESGVWHVDGKEAIRSRAFYADAVWSRAEAFAAQGADPDTVNRFLRNYETDGKCKSVLRQTQPMLLAAHDDVNKDPHLLNCRNGVVDLRTKTLLSHDPGYLQTKQTPGDYVPWGDLPEEDTQRFTDFLRWACDEDDSLMRLVCRSAGYSLTGETSEEVLFLLFGTTRSGKSTLSEGLASVLGYGYSGSLDATIITNSRNQRGNVDDKLARVAGCRLVNCAEPPAGERFTEGLVKAVTSGDRMSAAFKFVTAFEFVPRWKIWISTNHTPGSEDRAVHRRLVFIPFRHTVPKHLEDSSLKEWIKDPHRGGRVLLSWAVEGAHGWYEEGLRYRDCAVAQEWMEMYEEDEDPVGAFLAQCVMRDVGDKNLWPGTKELYTAFEQWTWRERQTTKVIGFQRFNHQIEAAGLMRGKHPSNGKRVWRDIMIKVNPATQSY